MSVDKLIDAVAHEMTDVTPSPEFRARVMTNLGRPRAGRRQALARVAAAAAAIAAVAMWLPRPGGVPDRAPTPEVEQAGVLQRDLRAAEAVPPARPRTVKKVERMSADEAAWLARSVRPLARLESIDIDSIQPSAPIITPISVEAFGPSAIEIPPIDVRAGGGR